MIKRAMYRVLKHPHHHLKECCLLANKVYSQSKEIQKLREVLAKASKHISKLLFPEIREEIDGLLSKQDTK